MKKITLYILSLTALMMAACGQKKQDSTENTPTVKIDTVKNAQGEGLLQYPGKVVPAKEVNMSFKVAGQLKRVYVGEGDRVSAGQLVAELDATDYEIQLSATEAEHAQIKADAERVMGLYEEGGTTASNYDKARYGLQQINAKLENHRNQVAYTKIYAPFSGYVQKRYFDGGETVAAGMPIVSVMGTGNLEVEVNLPATSYVNRESFTQFQCSMDVLPDETLPLQLISILQKANSNQLYTMRLKLQENGNEKVAPGMSAWVTILTNDSTMNQMRVPTTSLVEEDGATFVYLFNSKDNSVKRSAVKMCTLHTDGTAVVEGSLHVGDLVVSSGVHHIEEGMKVKAIEPVSKTNVGGLL